MTDPRDRMPARLRLAAAYWLTNAALLAAVLAFALR
jgi:hypothetical protein